MVIGQSEQFDPFAQITGIQLLAIIPVGRWFEWAVASRL